MQGEGECEKMGNSPYYIQIGFKRDREGDGRSHKGKEREYSACLQHSCSICHVIVHLFICVTVLNGGELCDRLLTL